MTAIPGAGPGGLSGAAEALTGWILERLGSVADRAVTSDVFAAAAARTLAVTLELAAPVQATARASSGWVLGQLDLPSRTQVVELGRRLRQVELALDDLDELLHSGRGATG